MNTKQTLSKSDVGPTPAMLHPAIDVAKVMPPANMQMARALGNNFIQDEMCHVCQARASQPGDLLEQQAEQTSLRLLDQLDGRGKHSHVPSSQDELNGEEEAGAVDEAAPLQSLPSRSNALESRLAGRYGPGQPLSKDVRQSVEPLLGYDLSPVRTHPDAGQDMAAAVQARAFTVGHHIYFGKDEYRPASRDGMRVLLHELAHTSQPGGETIQRMPSVSSWDFRTSGSRASDNCAPSLAGGFKLGTNNHAYGANSFTNGAEMQARLSNHEAGASYDIKRIKERSTWQKVAGAWSNLTHIGPGADDDANNDDECLSPSTSPEHIYSADGPGFNGTGALAADATEAVYKATFTESVEIKDAAGNGASDGNLLDWHTITWLTKTGGTWTFDAGRSEIATGSVTVGTTAP